MDVGIVRRYGVCVYCAVVTTPAAATAIATATFTTTVMIGLVIRRTTDAASATSTIAIDQRERITSPHQ